MAATTCRSRSRKKRQLHQRQRKRAQKRQKKPRVKKKPARHPKRGYGKRTSRKPPRKIQKKKRDGVRMTNEAQKLLHLYLHDFFTKVSSAAERLRKKKCHDSVTVADVRYAMQNVMPMKLDRKSVSSCRASAIKRFFPLL